MEYTKNNIEVVLQHLQERNEDFNGKLNAHETIKIMQFLLQCENQNLELIGIGYKVYKGDKKYHELDMKQMYEGGFSVVKH